MGPKFTKMYHLGHPSGLGPEMNQNSTETYHLQHLGSLGPEMLQNFPKTINLNVYLWATFLAPNGSLFGSFGPFWSPEVNFLTFGITWRHFWYLSYTFDENMIKHKMFFLIRLRNYVFLGTRTCKATADYRMHPYLCKAPNFPRPGAGILPQATEITFLEPFELPDRSHTPALERHFLPKRATLE